MIVRVIGWIGAIPFIAGLVGMLLLGWNSDRSARTSLAFCSSTIDCGLGARGVVFSSAFERFAGDDVHCSSGSARSPYLPAFWALPSAFLTSVSAAAAVGFINCTASIGGFVGPKIFGDLSQRTGSFNSGFADDDRVLDHRISIGACCVRESGLTTCIENFTASNRPGVDIDPETRCPHYHGRTRYRRDKFKCCGNWFRVSSNVIPS